ncbi:hypothetical protein JTB14_022934 [Gonioctena quinquepunctata]|nr:hypothetical protein JTB14_022934 [Gonioctena quinquepunctata]
MAVDEKEPRGHRERGEKRVRKVQDQEKSEHWRTAFPPNITVDELWLYRKRKPDAAWLADNLKIGEGSFKYLKTEYTRRFKNFYETLKILNGDQKDIFPRTLIRRKSSLKLEGAHDFQSNYNESFRKYPSDRLSEPIHEIIDKKHMENELANGLPALPDHSTGPKKTFRKRRLLRRPTNLEIRGDYSHITEHADKFIEYLLAERTKLCRTPTTLKLEGDMATKTETSEQYINFEKFDRPPLCKKFSELHLEGDFDILTEKQKQFVPFEIQKRPPLVKKSTNLHLEGDQFMMPEYKQQYVFHDHSERPKMIMPLNHLRTGGMLSDDEPQDRNMHPLIPFLRDSDDKRDDGSGRRRRNLSTGSHLDYGQDIGERGTVLSRVSSHPNLGIAQGTDKTMRNHSSGLDQKNAYIDSSSVRKSTPTRRSRREGLGLSYLKGDGKLDAKPEYSRAFVDFPRQRPSVRRPVGQLSSDGEVDYITEKEDKFIDHKSVRKNEFCRRKPELRVEAGRFECQPEYRKAYIDYLIREKPPTLKVTRAVEETETNEMADLSPSDNLSSTSETAEKPEPTSSAKKTKTMLKVPSSPSVVPPSPKISKRSQQDKLSTMETVVFGPKTSATIPRGTWSRGSLTPPSPRSPSRLDGQHGRGRSPLNRVTNVKRGSWRVPEMKGSISSDTDGWYSASETDPAFLIIDDTAHKRSNIRNNLYKEQKWMPSWYSVQ